MFGRIVRRMRTHPDVEDSTPMCACIDVDRSLHDFNKIKILNHVHSVAAKIGEDHLGFGDK